MASGERRLTALAIVCPTCRAALPGETAEELVDLMQEHIEQQHPELIGRFTDDDLLDGVHGE